MSSFAGCSGDFSQGSSTEAASAAGRVLGAPVAPLLDDHGAIRKFDGHVELIRRTLAKQQIYFTEAGGSPDFVHTAIVGRLLLAQAMSVANWVEQQQVSGVVTAEHKASVLRKLLDSMQRVQWVYEPLTMADGYSLPAVFGPDAGRVLIIADVERINATSGKVFRDELTQYPACENLERFPYLLGDDDDPSHFEANPRLTRSATYRPIYAGLQLRMPPTLSPDALDASAVVTQFTTALEKLKE